MEKIGLFELIDKITAPASGQKSFSASENKAPAQSERANDALRDPDFGAQPQYMMNAKMQAFLSRHENLKAEIPPQTKKRRATCKADLSERPQTVKKRNSGKKNESGEKRD